MSAQKPNQSAFLHRFVSLNDRHSTQVLTFILPPHLVKGYLSECSSKDFVYAYQRWRAVFTRDERHLGCHLVLRTPAEGTEVTIDFAFTVLNRDHFTGNASYQQKATTFNSARQRAGRATFLCVADLQSRGFLFPDYKALVELEVKAAGTTFCEDIPLPRDSRQLTTMEKLESSYFSFAGCDWSLSVRLREPDELGELRSCQPGIVMCRHSGLDHWCRIRYRITFQSGEAAYTSDVIDQMLDAKGYGECHIIEQPELFVGLNSRHPLRLSLSLLSMWPVTTVDLVPTSRHKNAARCYDTDKQQWIVESDILGRQLKLRLFYSDVKNVPRHFCRLVCWNASVIPYERDRPIVRAVNGPFTSYHSQKDSDDGFDIEMNLPVEEICDDNAGYTEPETGYLTAQIEWLHSHLLYQDFYHHYDDTARLHKYQMGREVATLQCENYSLEKQLFSYQISISRKDAGADGGSQGSQEAASSNESRDSGISTVDARQRHSAGAFAGLTGIIPVQAFRDKCGMNS